MKYKMLLSQIAFGEDFTCQFKADVKNIGVLTSEVAAFCLWRYDRHE